MGKPIVRYEIDLSNSPRLTAEQKAELMALAAMPAGWIVLEECGAESVLSYDEDLDYGAHRLRCAGLAAVARKGISVADQCDSAAGDVGGVGAREEV